MAAAVGEAGLRTVVAVVLVMVCGVLGWELQHLGLVWR